MDRNLNLFCIGPLLLIASSGVTVFAQNPDDTRIDDLVRSAFALNSRKTMPACEATPIRPELDFSLRYQTGFTMDLPSDVGSGPHHYGVILLRITPDNGLPAYRVSRLELPEKAKTTQAGRIRGSFVVAGGQYSVEMIFGDEVHQVCRSEWHIEIPGNENKRHSHVDDALLNTAVSSSGSHLGTPRGKRPNLRRITMLVHIAPSSPQSSRFSESDEMKMVGSVSALLKLPAQSVRLVAFNLEQQKILFEKDGFTEADVRHVSKIMNELQFGVVDFATLGNPFGATDLLTQLMEQERSELSSSDALVYLGMHVRGNGSLHSSIEKKVKGGPHVFYLECVPPPSIQARLNDPGIGSIAASSAVPKNNLENDNAGIDDRFAGASRPDNFNGLSRISTLDQPGTAAGMPSVDQPDLIEQLVRRVKGEVILIGVPSDCARALHKIAAETNAASVTQTASRAH